MAVHEGLVLKNLEPSIREDPDQWPEFCLQNVKIVSQTTGEPTSILRAHKGSPVRVEGFLDEVDPVHVDLVRTPNYQDQTIAIKDVSTYSFSQYEDGTFGFWAGGGAGWFELTSPARAYQHIFKEVNEAIGMFYFLADKYKKTRKSFAGAGAKSCERHINSWFNDYFNSDHCIRVDADDVREGFYQHRDFLIKSMLEGQEGLDWKASPIWRYFKLKFPGEFTTIERIILNQQVANTDPDVEIIGHASVASRQSITGGKEASLCLNWASASHWEDTKPINETEYEDEPIEDSPVTISQVRPNRKSGLRLKGNNSQKTAARKETVRSTSQNRDDDSDPSDEAMDMDKDDSQSITIHPQNSNPVVQSTIFQQAAFRGIEKTSSRIIKSPLPSYYEPRGHGDTWDCPYDGCNQHVWNARDAKSIERINLHFVEFHASYAQDLINQESRPWVSVDHLVERVKKIASLQAKVAPQRPGFPSRVIRRY